ncbi:alcohol dehydrogenase catalytic domain-containing protein [Streptomyces lavendulocolor]|uniref:alcohol dehydrogenase catalytic domain-containing protein n=1 Tax=Streptomyces lavendulocolor TaxID=67316 RepID=UPI003C2DB9B8
MKAAVVHAPGDIRIEDRPDPQVRARTDAIVRVDLTCVCGTDLWIWRGQAPYEAGQSIGHEFVGTITDTGPDVRLRPGTRVIAPFAWSDGTCNACRRGLHTSCGNGGFWGTPGADGAQGEAVRVPYADATLVAVPDGTDTAILPALLALSDILPTAYHAVTLARVRPRDHVIIVGDGPVGLLTVQAARRAQAGRISLIGHHPERHALARHYGATDTHTDDQPVLPDMDSGSLADTAIDCVGTASSYRTCLAAVRDGGRIAMVGVPYTLRSISPEPLFNRNITFRPGVTPARTYIPRLLPHVLAGSLDPTGVFDTPVALSGLSTAYHAMATRTGVKPLINPHRT